MFEMTATLVNPVRILIAAAVAVVMFGGLLIGAPRAEAGDEAATIHFLNPSTGSSLKISDKQAKDQTFALTAWVSNSAEVKLVEFEISSLMSPLSRASTIGAATLVAPDTYELQWAVPSTFTDGRYSLRAIAYGHSGEGYFELSTDEETVTLLSTAETVDITAPVRNGELGMYVPDGRAAGGSIDTAQSSATGFVRIFYTTSRPGTEPVWKPCGFEPTKKAADGTPCVLGATDTPAAITAVSAVANSTPYMDAQGKDTGKEQPDPAADQTADATRISTYAQVPTTVTLDPATQKLSANDQGIFPCSGPIKVVVTDQHGDGILGANIDVHASGPTNGVYFEVLNAVSKNIAPDKNHAGTENAYNCTGTPTDSTEKHGVHRTPGGLSIKHMESDPKRGTDGSGAFSFKLFSDSPGTTSFTAWVDVKDDDRFCAGEPAGVGTIGWGSDAAPATVEEPEEGCGGKVARTIALQAGAYKTVAGEKVEFVGAITSDDSACLAEQVVNLQRRAKNETKFRTISTRRTSEVGVYRFRSVVRKTSFYRSVAPATKRCVKATSLPVKVRTL